MRILALDLGTRTGWALWDGYRRESGVQLFEVKRGESPGMRYVRFRRWLQDVTIARGGIGVSDFPRLDLIVFEQAHHRGGAATEVAAGFSTRVLEHCAEWKIEHTSIHTATLKKATCGKGNASKEEMLAAVAAKWKAVTDDNEADAIALLYYAIAELAPVRA
jgi:crossover junction endodeoxyribonuclease RuvC